jgi:hypothetical protein
MPRKRPKLATAGERVAAARRIIEAQQALLEKLRINGRPTNEADGALRMYVSSLLHRLAHEERLRKAAKDKRGEPRAKLKLTHCRVLQQRGAFLLG